MPAWWRNISRPPQRSNSHGSVKSTDSSQWTWKSIRRSLSRSRSRNKTEGARARARETSEDQRQIFRDNVHPTLRPTLVLSDLTPSEKEAYAQILRTDTYAYPSPEDFHSRTTALIKDLDPRLQEQTKADSLMFAQRLAAWYKMGRDIGAVPKKLCLCETHNRLNEQLVLSIRICVEAYVKDHLQDLLNRVPPCELGKLSTGTQRCITALQDRLAIIMRPRQWCTLFNREFPQEFRHRANRCDACFLGAIIDSLRSMTGLKCIIDVAERAELSGADACAVARDWVDACLKTWSKDKIDRVQSTGAVLTSNLLRALSLEQQPQRDETKRSSSSHPPTFRQTPSEASTRSAIPQSSLSTTPTTFHSHYKSSNADTLSLDTAPTSLDVPESMAPNERRPIRPRQRHERMPIEVAEDALRAYQSYGRKVPGLPHHNETPEAFVQDVVPDPLNPRRAPMTREQKAAALRSRIVRPGYLKPPIKDGRDSFRSHAVIVGNEWPKINVYDGSSAWDHNSARGESSSNESLNSPWHSRLDPTTKRERIEAELMAALYDSGKISTPGRSTDSADNASPHDKH